MSTRPIFSVTNHHVEGCGNPPQIDDTTPNQYRGYFESQDGEQAMFLYDRATRQGTLYLGDAGWEHPHRVVEGNAAGLVLGGAEKAWLALCWSAATVRPRAG